MDEDINNTETLAPIWQEFLPAVLAGLRQREGWPEKYTADASDEVLAELLSFVSPEHVDDDWFLIIKPDRGSYRIYDVPTGAARSLRFAIPGPADARDIDRAPLVLEGLQILQKTAAVAGNKDKLKSAVVKRLKRIEEELRGHVPGAKAADLMIKSMVEHALPRIQETARHEAEERHSPP